MPVFILFLFSFSESLFFLLFSRLLKLPMISRACVACLNQYSIRMTCIKFRNYFMIVLLVIALRKVHVFPMSYLSNKPSDYPLTRALSLIFKSKKVLAGRLEDTSSAPHGGPVDLCEACCLWLLAGLFDHLGRHPGELEGREPPEMADAH